MGSPYLMEDACNIALVVAPIVRSVEYRLPADIMSVLGRSAVETYCVDCMNAYQQHLDLNGRKQCKQCYRRRTRRGEGMQRLPEVLRSVSADVDTMDVCLTGQFSDSSSESSMPVPPKMRRKCGALEPALRLAR